MSGIFTPETLGPFIAAAAIAGGVCAAFWPKTVTAPPRSRVRSVAIRRDTLRESHRTGEGSESKIDQTRVKAMRKTIESFRMQDMLENNDLRNRLLRAGYKSRSAPVVYVFLVIMLPFILASAALIWFGLLSPKPFDPVRHGGFSMAVMVLGYFLPQMWIKNKADARIKLISRAYPDALDLSVICVESGMSVEKSFHRVAEEISVQSVELGEEMGLLNAELGYLGDRGQAYDNFANRTGVPSIKALTSALVQAERYGTPVGQALRVLADESRSDRMAFAEQKAASLPAKLTVPMILFFLPVLFVVIIGPIAVRMMTGEG